MNILPSGGYDPMQTQPFIFEGEFADFWSFSQNILKEGDLDLTFTQASAWNVGWERVILHNKPYPKYMGRSVCCIKKITYVEYENMIKQN